MLVVFPDGLVIRTAQYASLGNNARDQVVRGDIESWIAGLHVFRRGAVSAPVGHLIRRPLLYGDIRAACRIQVNA